MKKYQAVLLDLDGTLLDTANDLGHALNHLLTEHHRMPIAQDIIRPYAGKGCKGLLKLGFDLEDSHEQYPVMSTRLLGLYQHYVTHSTDFFPGMQETLQILEKNNIPWGIVTNKPGKFTDRLVQHLDLKQRARCVISGDTLAHRKPHPEPILHGCKLLQIEPAHCIYVGDSEVDIRAGKLAGTGSLAAMYGYISADETPESWGADGYIRHPAEILNWLQEILK